MRWPIQVQLLLPILLVVTLGIALSGLAGANFGRRWAQQQQEEHLRRVVGTLTDMVFPLNQTVLLKMRGLSGAEFVLLDNSSRALESTLPVSERTLRTLRQIPPAGQWAEWSEKPAVELSGQRYRASRLPLARRISSVGPASLVVLYPEDRRWAATRPIVYPAALAGAVTALVAILVTTFLARRFVQPIQRLLHQTAAIADGDFRPVDLGVRNDEIRDLGLSINRMAEKLGQYEAEVRRHEQLRVLGQLSAGMAHQLRNAATGARMAVELHRRECPHQADRESLDVALRQMKLMESYLQRFVTLGRPSKSIQETVRLSALVNDTLELVRPACAHAKIRLEFEPPATELCVEGDAEHLRQLVMNLLLNAVDAAGQRQDQPPQIVVALRRCESRVSLTVEDSGEGPGPEVASRLFEPFVTGKPDGTGLGLWVARQIATLHQGTISWRRADDRTCFTVDLPLLTSRDHHGTPACCG